MRNKLILELLGTFFLSCAALMSEAPLSVAAMLCALIYMGGPISGAHYNPAVTLAVWIRGRISWKQSLAYVGVQLLAAFLAALLVGSLLGYDHDHAKDSLAALGDSVFSDAYGSSVTEFFGTFILALVILLVATSRLTAGNGYFGLAIALTVLGVAGAFAQFNPVINPAVGFALSLQGLASALFGDGTGAGVVAKEFIYLAKVTPRLGLDLFCQLLGGAAAGGLFLVLYPEDR